MTKLVVPSSVVWCLVACASNATLGYGDETQNANVTGGGAGVATPSYGGAPPSAGATGGTNSSTGGQPQPDVPAWAQGLGGTYSTDPIKPPPVDPSVLAAGTVPPGCEQRQEPFNPTISYRGYIQSFQNASQWPSEVMILKFTELTTSAVSGRVLSDQAGAGNYAELTAPLSTCFSFACLQTAQGFQYTMSQGSFDGQRLRFTVNLYEPACAWCGQQSPFAWGNGLYGCAPQGQGYGSTSTGCALLPEGTSEWQQWDCGAVNACKGAPGPMYCACSADACTAASSALAFDLAVIGNQLTGPAGTLGNVILTRETS